MDEYLRLATEVISRLAEGGGALIITIALLRAGWDYILNLVRRQQPLPRTEIRLGLGRSLGLALEFLLAADIVRTAIAPTWDDIGKLAAIAGIRTALNYFLEREIGAYGARALDEQSTNPAAGRTDSRAEDSNKGITA